MKIVSVAVLMAFILTGCDEKTNQASTLDNCSITNQSNDTFTFRCGLNDAVSSVAYQNKCNVYYSDNGQPNRFDCEELPETIESYTFKGATLQTEWDCKGLDGYGGYQNFEDDITKHSRLVFDHNGKFNLYLKGKENSSDIWHFPDSIISGDYGQNDTNGLILIPTAWNSYLLDATKFEFKDAPYFMLVKPLNIDITNLSASKLEGVAKWVDNKSNHRGNIGQVSCTAINTENVKKQKNAYDFVER